VYLTTPTAQIEVARRQSTQMAAIAARVPIVWLERSRFWTMGTTGSDALSIHSFIAWPFHQPLSQSMRHIGVAWGGDPRKKGLGSIRNAKKPVGGLGQLASWR
jgi:hypothetical protein